MSRYIYIYRRGRKGHGRAGTVCAVIRCADFNSHLIAVLKAMRLLCGCRSRKKRNDGMGGLNYLSVFGGYISYVVFLSTSKRLWFVDTVL